MHKKETKAVCRMSTTESFIKGLEKTGHTTGASKRRSFYLKECEHLLGCSARAIVSSQESLAKAIIDLKFVVSDAKYRDQLSNSLYRYFAIVNGYESEEVDDLIRGAHGIGAYYLASLMKNMNVTR